MKPHKFEAPKIQGAYDPHPETPPTAAELDAADRDVRQPGQIDFTRRNAEIDAEPYAPGQLDLARQQAQILARRYGRRQN